MINKKIYFFLFLIIFPTFVFAEVNVYYLDLQKIMNESKAGHSIKNQLDKLHKDNLTQFEKTEKFLKEEEENILSKKNVIKKTDYETLVNELRVKVNDYRTSRKKIIDELNDKRLSTTKLLLQQINPIIAQYAAEESIQLILPKRNIIMGKTELDITEKILTIVNKKIKKAKVN
tara:strand:- start:79 stop:600 length:522 start_codon:yes stop_codon:yes gene_type:complete